MTPRDIEKLAALGYEVLPARGRASDCSWVACEPVWLAKLSKNPSGHIAWIHGRTNQNAGWAACKEHAQSEDGMRATMADKVRWLLTREFNDPVRGHKEPTIGSIAFSGAIEGSFGCSVGSYYVHFSADSFVAPHAAVDALFWKVP